MKNKLVLKELDLKIVPEEFFIQLKDKDYLLWLDSSFERPLYGTFSYFLFSPLFILKVEEEGIKISYGKKEETIKGINPFWYLKKLYNEYAVDSGKNADDDLPQIFPGFGGYLGYEMGRYIERLPSTKKESFGIPKALLPLYQFALSYHHPSGKWWICYLELEGGKSFEEVLKSVYLILDRKPDRCPSLVPDAPVSFKANFTRDGYIKAIEKAKDYIFQGEIYQVNLSQCFSVSYGGYAEELYLKLRRKNPGSYSAFFKAGDFHILSSSPELFLRVRDRRVETRPIKGTIARGNSPEEDESLKQKLLASEKDDAELNMIVDLERNDLGRVCNYGSVRVLRHKELESYARVHHLVSTVEGELSDNKDLIDLLRATFPGGSITGAPKIRAMEIIDELEPTERSVYTGSIGLIGLDGNMELNIAIRTMILKNKIAYFQAGGGIVYDSEPELEYLETLSKALAIKEALQSNS